MAETRTAEVVRREIESERRELARALERLRAETSDVKRQAGRRARVAVSLLALVAGVAAGIRLLVKRLRD